MFFLSFLLISEIFHNCESNEIILNSTEDRIDYIVDCIGNISLTLENNRQIRSITITEGFKTVNIDSKDSFVFPKLIFTHGNYINFISNFTLRCLEINDGAELHVSTGSFINVINLTPEKQINVTNFESYANNKLKENLIQICISDDDDDCNSGQLRSYDFSKTPNGATMIVEGYITITTIKYIECIFPKNDNIKLTRIEFISDTDLVHFNVNNLKTDTIKITKASLYGNVKCNSITVENAFIDAKIIVNGTGENYVKGIGNSELYYDIYSYCDNLEITNIKLRSGEFHGNVTLNSVKGLDYDNKKRIFFFGNIISSKEDEYPKVTFKLEENAKYRYSYIFQNVQIYTDEKGIECTKLKVIDASFNYENDYYFKFIGNDCYAEGELVEREEIKVANTKLEKFHMKNIGFVGINNTFNIETLYSTGNNGIRGIHPGIAILLDNSTLTLLKEKEKGSYNISGYGTIISDFYFECDSITIENCICDFRKGLTSINFSMSNVVQSWGNFFVTVDDIILTNVTISVECTIKGEYINLINSTFAKLNLIDHNHKLVVTADPKTKVYPQYIATSYISLNNVELDFAPGHEKSLVCFDIVLNQTVLNDVVVTLFSYYDSSITDLSTEKQTIIFEIVDYVETLTVTNVNLIMSNYVKNITVRKLLNATNSDVSAVDFNFINQDNSTLEIRNNNNNPIWIVSLIGSDVRLFAPLSSRMLKPLMNVSHLYVDDEYKIGDNILLTLVNDSMVDCKKYMTVNVSNIYNLSSITVSNCLLNSASTIRPFISELDLSNNGRTNNFEFSFISNCVIKSTYDEPVVCISLSCESLTLINTQLKALSSSIVGNLDGDLTLTDSSITNIFFKLTNQNIHHFTSNVKNRDVYCQEIDAVSLYLEGINLKFSTTNPVTIRNQLNIFDSTIDPISFKLLGNEKYDQQIALISNNPVEILAIEISFSSLQLEKVTLKSATSITLDIQNITLYPDSGFVNIDFNIVGEYCKLSSTNLVTIAQLSIKSITNAKVLTVENLNLVSSGNSFIVSELYLINSQTNDIEFSFIGPDIIIDGGSNKIVLACKICKELNSVESISIKLINVILKIVDSGIKDVYTHNLNANNAKMENIIFSVIGSSVELKSSPDVQDINISKIECMSLTIHNINIKPNNFDYAKIKDLDLYQSTIPEDIGLIVTGDDSQIRSDAQSSLYFNEISLNSLTIKNIKMFCSSPLTIQIRKMLSFNLCSIGDNINFDFNSVNDIFVSSLDKIMDLSTKPFTCVDLELNKVNLRGIEKNTEIQFEGLSLVSSLLPNMVISLVTEKELATLKSDSTIVLNFVSISAVDIKVDKIWLNGVGNIIAVIAGIDLYNSQILNIDFCVNVSKTSSENLLRSDSRDFKLYLNLVDVSDTVHFVNLDLQTNEPTCYIKAEKFKLDLAKLSDQFQVQLYGNDLEFTSNQDLYDVKFESIRNFNENDPVALSIKKITSFSFITVYINQLTILQSTIDYFIIYLKGDDVSLTGYNNKLVVKNIETNGISMSNIEISSKERNIYLKSKTKAYLKLYNSAFSNILFFIDSPAANIETNKADTPFNISLKDNVRTLSVTKAFITNEIYSNTFNNVELKLSDANISSALRFVYTDVFTVQLIGKGVCEVYVESITQCNELKISNIVLTKLDTANVFETKHLTFSNVDLSNIEFKFAASSTANVISGDGSTIKSTKCITNVLKLNNVIMDAKQVTSSDIAMYKAKIINNEHLVPGSTNSFVIVDQSKYNQSFKLLISTPVFEHIKADAVHIEVIGEGTINNIELLNGGTVTGENVIAENFDIPFERLPHIHGLINSKKYTVKLTELMTMSTTSNDAKFTSENTEFDIKMTDEKFPKLLFIPRNNPIGMKNISTTDENLTSSYQQLFNLIDFSNNTENKLIFEKFEKIIDGIKFDFSVKEMKVIKGTNPFPIKLAPNSYIEGNGLNQLTKLNEILLNDIDTIDMKGNFIIERAQVKLSSSVSFNIYDGSKLVFDTLDFVSLTANYSQEKTLKTYSPFTINEIQMYPCNGDNSYFDDKITINKVLVDFTKNTGTCDLPNIYGSGINGDNYNIKHDADVYDNNYTFFSELCLWNYRTRDDVLNRKHAFLVPAKSKGKTIRTICLNQESYLYIPNEESAQETVWISKEQLINIIIAGGSVFLIMIISFIVIVGIRLCRK